MTKVKIKSDGTAAGTRVIVDDQDLSCTIAEVRWSLKAGGMAEVTLKLTDVALDVDGQMAMKFEEPPRELPFTISPGPGDIDRVPVVIEDLK